MYDEGPDEVGKRRQRWRGGYGTRKEAQAALNDALARLERGDYIAPERLTFGEFVRERWLPVIAGERRKTTLASYERHLRKHVLPEIGGIPLQRLDASRLNRLYIDLTARGLSKSTVRVIAAVISAALKDAARWRLGRSTSPATPTHRGPSGGGRAPGQRARRLHFSKACGMIACSRSGASWRSPARDAAKPSGSPGWRSTS